MEQAKAPPRVVIVPAVEIAAAAGDGAADGVLELAFRQGHIDPGAGDGGSEIDEG
jgi:hypothetical protein